MHCKLKKKTLIRDLQPAQTSKNWQCETSSLLAIHFFFQQILVCLFSFVSIAISFLIRYQFSLLGILVFSFKFIVMQLTLLYFLMMYVETYETL